MIIDLEKTGERSVSGFDVCIVGAGAAGIILAVELARHGKRVAVVESGGFRREDRTQLLYQSEVVGVPYTGIHEGRFRVLGGSTTEWAGQILELDEFDFAERPWVPGSGWPFPKSELAPFYARAIELEGLNRSLLNDSEVWTACGLGSPELGSDLVCAFSRWCPQPNFARLHETTLTKHPELSLYLHTNACELLLTEDGETVRSVRCRTLTGSETFFSADHFVLCLGGIESSRFLLQPYRQGTPPWNKRQLVGRYYNDHILCDAAEIRDVDLRTFHHQFGAVFANGYKYQPKLKLAFDAQRRYSTLNVCGMVELANDDAGKMARARATARLLRHGRVAEVGTRDFFRLFGQIPWVLWRRLQRSIDPTVVYRRKGAALKLSVLCEQSPLSESRITLSSQRDVVGMFRSRLDWKVSADEIASIRRYTRIVQDAFKLRGLANIQPSAALFRDEASAVQKCTDFFHHMGGTRMATTERDGVVSPDLRLFGTRNAYVCSSSVFPSSGFSNPTHTLIALAVRLAKHLNDMAPVRRLNLHSGEALP
jgi:choline dehydrogenase-like flavoprotein